MDLDGRCETRGADRYGPTDVDAPRRGPHEREDPQADGDDLDDAPARRFSIGKPNQPAADQPEVSARICTPRIAP